jgi:ABC-type transport system substrate-binding protein
MDVVTLFINSAAADGKGPNWANAKIPSIDRGIALYQSSRTEAQLNKRSADLQVEIAKQLPFIPIVNREAFWVKRPNVHGYLVHQWNLYPYYNDVWLS